MVDETFGHRLMRLRREKGWNLEVLGKKAHISSYTINQYEIDRNLPSFHSLISLAKTLDVSLDYLCGIDE
jgi:transcriptional regulator with XRE-family HTH domain